MTARPLFNELLNQYHGENELHGPAFRMDNHRVGVSRQPCRPCRPAGPTEYANGGATGT